MTAASALLVGMIIGFLLFERMTGSSAWIPTEHLWYMLHSVAEGSDPELVYGREVHRRKEPQPPTLRDHSFRAAMGWKKPR